MHCAIARPAQGSNGFLRPEHVMALAHVMRRPIIVYCDKMVRSVHGDKTMGEVCTPRPLRTPRPSRTPRPLRTPRPCARLAPCARTHTRAHGPCHASDGRVAQD